MDDSTLAVETVKISGDVTIGGECCIHPHVDIKATNGPIVIGRRNIIEERVVIENLSEEVMRIGDGNIFEVGALIRAQEVQLVACTTLTFSSPLFLIRSVLESFTLPSLHFSDTLSPHACT